MDENFAMGYAMGQDNNGSNCNDGLFGGGAGGWLGILLLIALSTGLLEEEKIAEASDFFIRYMPILFVAPAAKLLQYWDLISPHIAAICIITAVSTVVVFAVSGLVTKWVIGRKERRNND